MKILSINKTLLHNTLNFINIKESELSTYLSTDSIESYHYIIINGGDGTIRRVMKILQDYQNLPPFILNPTGSFNVVAKRHRVPPLEKVLDSLVQNQIPKTQTQQIYTLNKDVFLFSAGNMGDLQHIFLSETLRFGVLENGIAKYLLAVLFLFPVHLIMTPFMLLSSRRFFVFTPASFIRKFGSFYGKIEENIHIDLENDYNLIELDGDIVTIKERILQIKVAKTIEICID